MQIHWMALGTVTVVLRVPPVSCLWFVLEWTLSDVGGPASYVQKPFELGLRVMVADAMKTDNTVFTEKVFIFLTLQ